MNRLRRLRRSAALLLTVLAAVAVQPAAGQRAAVYLEPGHWSWDAIRRLHAAGLAPPAGDRVSASVTRRHALAVFTASEEAARAAGRTDLAVLAASYRSLLLAESDTAGLIAGAALSAGWASAAGDARGGDGYFIMEDWQGAQPLPRLRGPGAGMRAWGWAGDRLGWAADIGWLGDDAVVGAATLSAALGPFDVWAGRRRLQYGVGRGGGTVMAGALHAPPALWQRTGYTFQGAGAEVREAFHFPGFLRFLGATRIEATMGRMARVGRVDRPWVAFGRLVGSPFSERFTLGVNRGAIFAGDDIPITPGRLFGLLYGAHGGEGGEFENQVFSAIATFRPPLGHALPLLLYVEWGMDDTSGAVSNTPGVVAGFDLGAVPGLPALAVGAERTSFAQSCCGQPIWYRHIYYRGSWADEGRLFAHPLGGHGREWLAHARLDLPARGVLARADVYTRDRYHENLFALERMGRSRGASAGLEARLPGRASLRLDADYERGVDWEATRLTTFLTAWPGRVR
jgi:hypothetical protein